MSRSLFVEQPVQKHENAIGFREFFRRENVAREVSASELRGSSEANGIRKVQLPHGSTERRSAVDGATRDTRNFLYPANSRVRSAVDDQRQRPAQRDSVRRHHHVITPVGLSGRHSRPTESDNADALHLVHHHGRVEFRQVVLGFYSFALLQWTFVS